MSAALQHANDGSSNESRGGQSDSSAANSSDAVIEGMEKLAIEEKSEDAIITSKHIPSFISSLGSRRDILPLDSTDPEGCTDSADRGSASDHEEKDQSIEDTPESPIDKNVEDPNFESIADDYDQPNSSYSSETPPCERDKPYAYVAQQHTKTQGDEYDDRGMTSYIKPSRKWKIPAVVTHKESLRTSGSLSPSNTGAESPSPTRPDGRGRYPIDSNNYPHDRNPAAYDAYTPGCHGRPGAASKKSLSVPTPIGSISDVRGGGISSTHFSELRRESEISRPADKAGLKFSYRAQDGHLRQAFPNTPTRLQYPQNYDANDFNRSWGSPQSSSKQHLSPHLKISDGPKRDPPYDDGTRDYQYDDGIRDYQYDGGTRDPPYDDDTRDYQHSPYALPPYSRSQCIDAHRRTFQQDEHEPQYDDRAGYGAHMPMFTRDRAPSNATVLSDPQVRQFSNKSQSMGSPSQSLTHQMKYGVRQHPAKMEQHPPINYAPPPSKRNGSITADISTRQTKVYPTNVLETLESLEKLTAKNPGNLELQFLLAKTLINAVQVLSKDDDAHITSKKMNKSMHMAEKAIKCLKKVINEANVGSPFYPQALFALGECHGNGLLGLVIDHKRALYYYKKAEKLNHASSIYKIGFCYEVGAGVRANSQKAMQRYSKASALGDSAAMCKIGTAFLYGIHGFPRKPAEAVEWFKRAIDRNDINSSRGHYELAKCYEGEAGSIMGSSIQLNNTLSLQHYNQAARLGFVPAQNKLGSCFEFGLLDLRRDFRKSIYWYSRAAERGDTDAQLALASWYLTGAEGILEQSDSQAFLWANRAATNGNPRAAYVMGYMHANGIGVVRDLLEGRKWYIRALNLGIKSAHSRTTEINAAIEGHDYYAKRFFPATGRRIENRLHKKYGDPECQIT